MGRYYSGDISGKFWFAVQDSDAADRFGQTGNTPNVLTYYYQDEDIPQVKAEIEKIEASIDLDKITKFFDKGGKGYGGYDDEMLEKAGITYNELKEYADLLLGRKILGCLEDSGECEFEAEIGG